MSCLFFVSNACHRVDIQSFAEWVGGWMDERNKQIGRKMIPRALSRMPRNQPNGTKDAASQQAWLYANSVITGHKVLGLPGSVGVR